MKSNLFITALALALAFSACKKDDPPTIPNPTFGDLSIQIEHVWGANAVPIAINQKIFHPKTGDTITLTTFQYYISNIQVKKAGGEWYVEPDSYHLIDLADPNSMFIMLKNIPTGNYDEIKYVMGVDSARNVGGAQVGDLNPANGMFWNFTDGYIMIKAEGDSPNSPTGKFKYHLGGFAGPDKNVMNKYQQFSNIPATVNENAPVTIVLEANPAKIWHHFGSVSNGHEVLTPGFDAHELGFDFQDAVHIAQVIN